MEKFLNTLRNLLPDSFKIKSQAIKFDNELDFNAVLKNNNSFTSFIKNKWNFNCENHYIDTFQSGFLGSYALALWFMQFDQDNWFTFNEIHTKTKALLNSYSSVSERSELRLIKGSFKPMNLDLPIIVNYKDQTITVMTGQLND